MLELGPAWMTRPYSEDIRERALARADSGETVRSIAEELQISPSCVTKWKNLRRETGGISPGKIGGHNKRRPFDVAEPYAFQYPTSPIG